MKIAELAFGAFAFLGAILVQVDAQAQTQTPAPPSPPKEQPGPGSAAQEGTGSNPTQAPRPDPGGQAPSTTESPDNKRYGRETQPEGQQLDQSNKPPARQ